MDEALHASAPLPPHWTAPGVSLDLLSALLALALAAWALKRAGVGAAADLALPALTR